ncbi:hypothetical protein THIOM_003766 [Candidatus Thiomargarita nelsonii]|uniref:Uncharacterized protein n=1 Tax=Candidatus Thiomargarita nelsonii TaxID=1003181 RepID=A0A176RXN6_9GAMM|nr:hypothetical protein THIOM_003766 [Candidatus Thiomargarita nelsonii]
MSVLLKSLPLNNNGSPDSNNDAADISRIGSFSIALVKHSASGSSDKMAIMAEESITINLSLHLCFSSALVSVVD